MGDCLAWQPADGIKGQLWSSAYDLAAT